MSRGAFHGFIELLEGCDNAVQLRKNSRAGRPRKHDVGTQFAVFLYFLSRPCGLLDWDDHFGLAEVILYTKCRQD